MVKVTYDTETDAAYIYLKGQIEPGEVKKTYPCDPIEVNGEINLDFDKDGTLIGIEVLDASKMLSKEMLQNS